MTRDYMVHLLTVWAVLAVAAIAAELLLRQIRLVPFAAGGILGVGAYAVVITARATATPSWSGVLVAVIFGAVAGLLLGTPMLWLRGEAAVIAVIGAQVALEEAFRNLTTITNGDLGIFAIASPASPNGLLTAAFVLLAVAIAVPVLLSRVRGGAAVKVAGYDRVLAAAIGHDPRSLLLIATCITGSMIAAAGALHAYLISFVEPRQFGFSTSLALVTVAAIGSGPWSSAAAAGVIVALPEIIRAAGMVGEQAASLREIVNSIAVLAVIAIRSGWFGEPDRAEA
ncbi:MAG TPA: branched-chain amino acid ABC transporter permease [Thermoanaerobaculia bacterium]|nr:branched-chain amino acid ABC transporter permease [Thermoanaerobaculia bacterium]